MTSTRDLSVTDIEYDPLEHPVFQLTGGRALTGCGSLNMEESMSATTHNRLLYNSRRSVVLHWYRGSFSRQQHISCMQEVTQISI
jgi:hypothetical protein